jgi:glycosyltransferase involved in cell wall biosynthesis
LVVRRSNTRQIFADHSSRVEEFPFYDEPNSLATEFRLGPSLPFTDVELFHSPFQILPRKLPCPSVVTVHDLMWLTTPELCSGFWPERVYLGSLYSARLKRVITRADHLIAISDATHHDVGGYDADAGRRTTAILHGVEAEFGTLSESQAQAQLPRSIEPGTPFVLCVGQGSPYKNHVRAIESFLHAFADHPEIKLVLVRRFSRHDSALSRLLATPAAHRQVIVLPKVAESELLALFKAARVFFFPSLKEGFGMPLLEAMMCGTPVLTSTAEACLEAAQDAALTAPATDVIGLSQQLQRLYWDDALREQMVAKGRLRARELTWEQNARQTLDVYRRVTRGANRHGP